MTTTDRRSYTLALTLAACLSGTAASAGEYVFHHENVMGTAMELRVRADDPGAAARAEARVLGEIDRLSAVFSGYDASSEFRRWQGTAGRPVKVSDELFEMLRACDRWRDLTRGAFDPRVEALSRLWAKCARLGRVPTADETDAVKVVMGRPAWRVDENARTAERLSDGPLTLDAIAKGYIVGRASEAALDPKSGVRGLLLNVGGDLRASGDFVQTVVVAPPGHDPSTPEPVATVAVSDRAVATSGNAHRGFQVNGRWYSHVLDTRSAAPVEEVISATVIAGRSDDADALATAFNVLTPEESARLADSLPGVACLVVSADGRVTRSARWAAFEAAPLPQKKAVAPKAPLVAPWDAFEMRVDYEINNPAEKGRRYRRPYVAVWVENNDGYPVRTLELLLSMTGSGPDQWIPDLRRWSASDDERKKTDKTDLAHTVSQSTKMPGKYSVVWDGRDDHGKPLPGGEYTVYLEAAREQGTYQSMKKHVTVGTTPFAEELTGDTEIKGASIDYHRKAPKK